MLRGSYAGGSLNVTARCPVRRPGPSAILHARVRAPVARLLRYPCGAVPISSPPLRVDLLCRATPPAIRGSTTPLRISATLCRCIAEHCCSFAFDRGASLRYAIAMRRIGLLRLSVAYAAVLCFSLALSRGATPSRDIAFQSRRPANLGGALPSPCHASLCLGHAVLRFAFASPRTSKPSLRCPYRSIAVACRGFASP